MSDKLASTEQMFGTPYYCGLLVDQSIVFNRRRDGSQSAKVREEDILYLFSLSIYIMLHRCKNVIHMTYFFQFREMLTEMRENKKAKKFTRFVPGARDGRSALEVMDNSFGGKASNLLLGNKGTVTERDKVQINQSTTNFANFISMKNVSSINCDIKIYFLGDKDYRMLHDVA